MFIQNFNLRKKLGMGRLLEANDGAGAGTAGSGSGEGEEEDSNTDESEEGEAKKKEDKTFTQADVDKLVQERIARTKKGQLSKEEIKAYQDWKDSQKTAEEKNSEALTNAETKVKEAEERATSLEAKVTCLSKGVGATSVDDVVVLAKAMATDEITVEQAIDKVLEKYPQFKGIETSNGEEQKGFTKVGSSGAKGKAIADEALANAFGNKK